MSYSIKADSTFLRTADTQSVSAAREKSGSVSGVEQEKKTDDATVQISHEAQLKLQHLKRTEEPRKKAGVTSARELFEDEAYTKRCYYYGIGGLEYIEYGNAGYGGQQWEEWMRLDEPETYAEYRKNEIEQIEWFHSLWDEFGNWKDEGKTFSESYVEWIRQRESMGIEKTASEIEWDWFNRKCRDEEGKLKNPLTGQSVVAALESLYSDETHDVTVDVYSENLQNADRDLWRFGTKFNVLIPAKMASELELLRTVNELSDSEKKMLQDKCDRVSNAVSNMKEAEKAFEGDLRALRFGVKLDEKGGVTYYAKYQRPWASIPHVGHREEDIETEDSVSATSVDELLQKLKEKDEKLRGLYETS